MLAAGMLARVASHGTSFGAAIVFVLIIPFILRCNIAGTTRSSTAVLVLDAPAAAVATLTRPLLGEIRWMVIAVWTERVGLALCLLGISQ